MTTRIHPSHQLIVFGFLLALAAPMALTSCDNNRRCDRRALVSDEEIEALKKAKSKLEAEVKQLRDNGDKAIPSC